ncbi:acyltransferase [Herbaspirillum rhizosphaerae]|uniref:Acyltransferase n=1 Tax=Herbaspirillum rhizosphaerae TaxID=346179 RepID=A0ABW8Z8C5_9BURK
MQRHNSPSALPNYGETNFITGMRAYAALVVVLIHAGGAGLRQLGAIGNHFADMGHAGVYVFFVISGFSVTSSYLSAPSYGSYLARRIWRVAPLYYFWIIVTASIAQGTNYWGQHFGMELDAYNWFMHVTFLGFLDYRVTNSIIGTEWSIPVEVFWYLLVPYIMGPITRARYGVLIAIPLSLAICVATTYLPAILPLDPDTAAIALYWSPIPYLLAYCLGISAFKLRQITPSRPYNVAIAAVLLASVIYSTNPPLFNRFVYNDLVFTSFATFALICLGSPKSFICRIFFQNRICLFLGTISYGIYLSHLPIKEALVKIVPSAEGSLGGFLLVALLSIIVSTATYYLIERRGLAISKWFERRLLSSVNSSRR